MTTEERKSKFIEYLTECKGIVTDAVRKWKAEDGINAIERGTHYLWLSKDPEYKKRVDDIQDVVFDFVESKLFELIEEKGSEKMVSLYMNLKGRHRNYVNSVDQNVKGETNINISFKEPEDDEENNE